MVSQVISMFSKQYLEPVRSTHSSIYYICVCYHQNLTLHKDRVNNRGAPDRPYSMILRIKTVKQTPLVEYLEVFLIQLNHSEIILGV